MDSYSRAEHFQAYVLQAKCESLANRSVYDIYYELEYLDAPAQGWLLDRTAVLTRTQALSGPRPGAVTLDPIRDELDQSMLRVIAIPAGIVFLLLMYWVIAAFRRTNRYRAGTFKVPEVKRKPTQAQHHDSITRME